MGCGPHPLGKVSLLGFPLWKALGPGPGLMCLGHIFQEMQLCSPSLLLWVFTGPHSSCFEGCSALGPSSSYHNPSPSQSWLSILPWQTHPGYSASQSIHNHLVRQSGEKGTIMSSPVFPSRGQFRIPRGWMSPGDTQVTFPPAVRFWKVQR